MADPVFKGQEIQWGTDVGVIANTITESSDITYDGDVKEFRDETGEVITAVFYNNFQDASVTVVAKPDATLPARGDFATVDGLTNFMIMKVGKKKKNDDGVRFDVTLKAFDGIPNS